MSRDASIQRVGVGSQPVDDIIPALADETIQRLQIFAHALGLLRHGLHEANGALVDDMVKGGDPLAERLMDAACSVRRRGRCVDGKRRQTLVDMRKFGVQRGHGLGRRGLDLRLGEGALGRDGADKATRGLIEQSLERVVLVVDHAAQLALAGVELFAPSRSREVEDRGCVFRAIPNHGAEPFARPGEPVFKRLAAHHDGVVQAFRGVAETHDETIAVYNDGVGEPLAAALEPLDQRIRPVTEVASDCVAGDAELIGDRVALDANRGDGLRAARVDPADDVV